MIYIPQLFFAFVIEIQIGLLFNCIPYGIQKGKVSIYSYSRCCCYCCCSCSSRCYHYYCSLVLSSSFLLRTDTGYTGVSYIHSEEISRRVTRTLAFQSPSPRYRETTRSPWSSCTSVIDSDIISATATAASIYGTRTSTVLFFSSERIRPRLSVYLQSIWDIVIFIKYRREKKKRLFEVRSKKYTARFRFVLVYFFPIFISNRLVKWAGKCSPLKRTADIDLWI